MKKLFALLAAAFLFMPASASALVGGKNLAKNYRVKEFCVTYLGTTVPAVATNQAVGVAGVILFASVNSGSVDISQTAGSTQAVGRLPYPVAVQAQVRDAYSDDTISCSTVTLMGEDQFGLSRTETLSSVGTGSAVNGSIAWTRISRITATCTGASSPDDRLWVAMQTTSIGLRTDVVDAADVEAVCLDDGGATYRCLRQDDGTANDIASAIDLTYNTIDINNASMWPGGATAAQGDGICIRTRPRRYPYGDR